MIQDESSGLVKEPSTGLTRKATGRRLIERRLVSRLRPRDFREIKGREAVQEMIGGMLHALFNLSMDGLTAVP